MKQEAIVSLRVVLDGTQERPARPDPGTTLEWLKRGVWTLPVLDQRGDNEILGYNAHGHFD